MADTERSRIRRQAKHCACQLAARNSLAVFARSSAARRSFSGSDSMTSACSGSMPCTGSISSTSAAAAIPCLPPGMALAMDPSMSSALGMEPISDFARWRILVGQSAVHWHGVAHTVEIILTVGALVGCVEFTYGVDLVAEEFDTHRMRQSGRKNVDDATADGEFAHGPSPSRRACTGFPPVCGMLRQEAVPRLRENTSGSDVPQACDHRLDEGAHRHDQNADGAEEQRAALFGMLQPAEHRHAACHSVRAW